MPEHSLFKLFIKRFNACGVSYMVTGAVASLIYGEPRLTHDIDIVLDIRESEVDKVLSAFPEDEFYRPPGSVVLVEAKRPSRGHFNLIHHDTGFKADIYLKGMDKLHEWALSNRNKVKMGEDIVWLAPPEYVIVRKLQYYREGGSDKHIKDIVGMLEVAEETIDFNALKKLINSYGLNREWERAKAFSELA